MSDTVKSNVSSHFDQTRNVYAGLMLKGTL